MALDMTGSGSAVIGGIGDILGGVVNNLISSWTAGKAREDNFRLNEMAADNADKRTRALYNDLQSPKALLQQYLDAGLSPSMMFGGTGAGGSVPQGAEGSGASGVNTQVFGINPLEAAQLELTHAQAEKTKAETDDIRGVTERAKSVIAELNSRVDMNNASTEYIKAQETYQNWYNALMNDTTGSQKEKIIQEGNKAFADAEKAAAEAFSANIQADIDEATKQEAIEKLKTETELTNQRLLNAITEGKLSDAKITEISAQISLKQQELLQDLMRINNENKETSVKVGEFYLAMRKFAQSTKEFAARYKYDLAKLDAEYAEMFTTAATNIFTNTFQVLSQTKQVSGKTKR